MKKILLVILVSCLGFRPAQADGLLLTNGKITDEFLFCSFDLNSDGIEYMPGAYWQYSVNRSRGESLGPSRQPTAAQLQQAIRDQDRKIYANAQNWMHSLYSVDTTVHQKSANKGQCDFYFTSEFSWNPAEKFKWHDRGRRLFNGCGMIGSIYFGATLGYLAFCNFVLGDVAFAQRYAKPCLIGAVASLGSLFVGYIWKHYIQYSSGLSLNALKWNKNGSVKYTFRYKLEDFTFALAQ